MVAQYLRGPDAEPPPARLGLAPIGLCAQQLMPDLPLRSTRCATTCSTSPAIGLEGRETGNPVKQLAADYLVGQVRQRGPGALWR